MNRRKREGCEFFLVVALMGIAAVMLSAGRCHGSIADAIDATCRVSVGNAKGTGCAFEKSQSHIFVLTCAHVVGNAQTANCEFWTRGHQSRPIAGTIVARSEAADAAVIAIPVSAFGGQLPSVIPLAKRDTQQRGSTITSVGCAKGGWSTAWKGHVLGYTQDGDLHFRPTPANGRSGSAVFDAKAERIVGLLRARTVNDTEGIASSVGAIRCALAYTTASAQRKKFSADGWRASTSSRLTAQRGLPMAMTESVWSGCYQIIYVVDPARQTTRKLERREIRSTTIADRAGTGRYGPWREAFCEPLGVRSFSYDNRIWPKQISGNEVVRLLGTQRAAYFAKHSQAKQSETYHFAAATSARLTAEECRPGDDCDKTQQQQPHWFLSPYRYRQQFRNNPLPTPQQTTPVYPTLPGPSAPSVDMGPTNQKLDRIADLLIEMQRNQTPVTPPMEIRMDPPPPLPMMPVSVVDPEAREAAADAILVAETVAKEVKAVKVVADGAATEVKVSMQELSGFRNVLNTLIGDRDTLRDRFEERIAKVKDELGEEATKREIGIAYVKDLVREKVASGAVGVGLKSALGLSGPPAIALMVGLWFLRRRVKDRLDDGEGLSITGLISEVKEGFRDLKDRLTDRGAAPAQAAVPAPGPIPQPIIINVPASAAAVEQPAVETGKKAK